MRGQARAGPQAIVAFTTRNAEDVARVNVVHARGSNSIERPIAGDLLQGQPQLVESGTARAAAFERPQWVWGRLTSCRSSSQETPTRDMPEVIRARSSASSTMVQSSFAIPDPSASKARPDSRSRT